MSGFLFKLVRESAGLTQSELADCLVVDEARVQGWESGRRPLGAMRTADLTLLRFRLLRCGVQSTLLMMLDDAIHADLIISGILQAGDQLHEHTGHPLGTVVHHRTLSDVITWPLTGIAPGPLRKLVGARVRRGPVPNHPTLTKDERTCFFDHLLGYVRASPDELAENALLARRQAVYLLGFDTRRTTAEWLHAEQLRALRKAEHTDHVPSWITVRSSAVALGFHGDRDPLRVFIEHGLATDRQEQANLNYWAYWVGEIHSIQINDSFMNRICPKSWSGVRLLENLLELLQPGHGHTELNLHTLWALIVSHPTLLSDHPYLRTLTANTVDQLVGNHNLSPAAQRELSDIAYAVLLAHQ